MTATSDHGARFTPRPDKRRAATMLAEMSLLDSPSCLAVVPAYNEAATVTDVVEELRRKRTRLRRPRGRRRLDRRHRRSRAEAAGARRAAAAVQPRDRRRRAGRLPLRLENGYDFMVQVDGDGQHDPAEIAKLHGAMRRRPGDRHGLRLALPDRRPATPRRSAAAPGIHIFAFLLSRLVGQRVSDPTSGFRLYNRRAIALFARDYPHDYPEVEAVLMLHHHRLTMREVPVRMFAARRRRRPRSARASRPTTWSRCCSRSSSGLRARAARRPSPASRRPSRRSTGSDVDAADPDRRDRRRRRRCC